MEEEWDLRRPFLWLPAAAGAGAIFYIVAPTEPFLWVVGAAAVLFSAFACAVRARRVPSALFVGLAALAAGEFSCGWRAARVEAPVLERAFVGEVAGFVEEVDHRVQGARFLLRVTEAEGLAPEKTPYRVRLTSRGVPAFAAGDFLTVKARLLPPAHAALPGGYDFARDAYFQRIGAVGNVHGTAEAMPAPETPDWRLRFFAGLDRARNALALRVYHAIGGDNGAIGAAMVTGKRDLLSEAARETIRKAGIFHIITISGVQMPLVAGIFFVGFRGLLALFPVLALNYPIKKWAAARRPTVPARLEGTEAEKEKRGLDENVAEMSRHELLGALVATFCATSATASFMAYDFRELSPYVLISNPLTLAMIDLFAVPARADRLAALCVRDRRLGLVLSWRGHRHDRDVRPLDRRGAWRDFRPGQSPA